MWICFEGARAATTAGSANVAPERNRQTVSFEELVYSNMMTLNALVELLAEKGLLSKEEVLERVKQLQMQSQAKKKLQ
jgi:hypothetical protein